MTIEVVSWRETGLGGAALGGVAGGYLMLLIGLWAGRVPGLVSVDIADFGRRYMVSDRPSAWLLGLASHLANSFLLALAWSTMVEPNLHGAHWLEGLLWGEFLAFGLAGALVAPMAGQGFMGRRSGSWRFLATNVVMHGAWGVLVGLLATGRR